MPRLHCLHRAPRRAALAAALAIAAVGPLAGACGSFGRGTAAAVPRAVVTFVNQSQELANVYAVGMSGEPFRIGSVPPGRTENLSIPASVFNSGSMVNFVARPLATARLVQSGPVSVRPGDRYTVTLPPAANTLSVLPGGSR